MSDLDQLMEREVILAFGEPGCGKTLSIVKLVEMGLEYGFNVVAIDRDRGMGKALREVFGKPIPDNFDYFLADEWDKIPKAIDYAFDALSAGDWLAFDMIGRFWDFAQEAYAEKVYGDLTDHLVLLRAEAAEEIRKANIDPKSKEARRIIGEKTGYGGFEGRTDWTYIKRMHNRQVFDRAIVDGKFNILSTSAAKDIAEEESKRNKWELFRNLQKRPEGEKHQMYRHDTIAYLYYRSGAYQWRTDLGGGRGKDRGGRELVKDVEYGEPGKAKESRGFVYSYLDYHGLLEE